MKQPLQSGLTLIELLIVVAIVGVLAATILASLNDARDTSRTAKIQAEMDAISKRAEIEGVQVGTYDIVCGSNGVPTSTVIENIITSINNFASSTVVCNSDTAEYAVSAPAGSAFWCVDSTGERKEISSELGAGVLACP